MEKRIVTMSYRLGLLSSLICLGLRGLNIFGILTPNVVQLGKTLWYMSFFKGALLFFLIAIATASYASVRGEKTNTNENPHASLGTLLRQLLERGGSIRGLGKFRIVFQRPLQSLPSQFLMAARLVGHPQVVLKGGVVGNFLDALL